MLARSRSQGLSKVSALLALVCGAAASLVLLVAPAANAADASIESQFIALMNSARQSAGLPAYAVASDLTSIARQHSDQMAASNTLYHNPSLTTQVQNWQEVGENVGVGPDAQAIHNAFMNSPEHRANILDHDYTQVGVGVTVGSDGRVWVTEDFRMPEHSTTAAAPAPAPAPAPRTVSSTPHVSATVSGSTFTPAPQPTGTQSAATHAPAPAPRPTAAQAARQRLLQSVLRLRSDHLPVGDPLAQTVRFAELMSTLAR